MHSILRLPRRILFGGFRRATILPSYLIYFHLTARNIVDADIHRWQAAEQINGPRRRVFFYFMRYCPEFRSLLHYRIPRTKVVSILSGPGTPALYIKTPNIGPGLFIQHGFSTIIDAKSIGSNCWIHQQVTIGFTEAGKHPVIGDNVMIGAGAIIIGDVTIGDNAVVGAGAVVTKDVPSGCIVVGSPAYIVNRNGVACHEPLANRGVDVTAHAAFAPSRETTGSAPASSRAV
jgi:serine O-acetyltransferase